MTIEEIEARLEGLAIGVCDQTTFEGWSVWRWGEDHFDVFKDAPSLHGAPLTLGQAARLIGAFQ